MNTPQKGEWLPNFQGDLECTIGHGEGLQTLNGVLVWGLFYYSCHSPLMKEYRYTDTYSTATYNLRVCRRLALVWKDIQPLGHFSPCCEAHKRNRLGNDGTIKENRNTNPASIMEKGGKLLLLWRVLDLIVSICCLFWTKKRAGCALIAQALGDAHCRELVLMQLVSLHFI